MKGSRKNSQSGFTLIELIMVVVILGILSAVAIPRFADLGSEARVASLEGLAGALKSSSAITHAKWLAAGGGATVDLEGATINVTSIGYPTVAGISTAAQIDTVNDYTATTAGTAITYTLTTAAGCTVVYEDNTGAALVIPPTVTVSGGAC